ncbi:NTP transferase domain-containing protein [Agromyces tardus]|uniref:NTP transferase domain-containing protein n=1 Tax=Agromyces tardus TaxID=2583849 RepID=UPI001FEA09D5|nr:NTP transferase domain-containing protein [Agromyces tardus]
MSAPDERRLDAVILAGGRAGRLGGASKPDLVVGGRRLLETAIEATWSAGARRVAVVGPPSLDAPGCLVVREDPPFGGPVAALAAGLAALPLGAAGSPGDPDADADVLVLACDMPDVADAVARLLEARDSSNGADADGICLLDASGRTQWLAALYSRRALEHALVALGDVDGAAMRRLAASLDLTAVPDGGSTQDIDTWSDLDRALHRRGDGTMTEPQGPGPGPDDLDGWVAEAAGLLGLDPADVPIGTVLDLARRAAHGVARPAAPVTTFMLGLAVGAGRPEDLATLAGRLGDLADRRGT